MNPSPRRARLRALAKINLSLKVIGKRPDGFHELRTVFQTVSLADRIDVEFSPAARTRLELKSSVDIADNLVLRAAGMSLDAMRITGHVAFRLTKRIPLGAGLGGGSSDAAAVLLALPVLAGRPMAWEQLADLASLLGSDVPFFLLGGTALGLGRGTELYPLPQPPKGSGLVVVPDLEISTREAYAALGRELTTDPGSHNMNSFQALSWSLGQRPPAGGWAAFCENDFETVVFKQHPQLKQLWRKLRRLGAGPARLSGSGSSLFGIFANRGDMERARNAFRRENVELISLVSRERYRAMWWRDLRAHMVGKLWPPRSRYAL